MRSFTVTLVLFAILCSGCADRAGKPVQDTRQQSGGTPAQKRTAIGRHWTGRKVTKLGVRFTGDTAMAGRVRIRAHFDVTNTDVSTNGIASSSHSGDLHAVETEVASNTSPTVVRDRLQSRWMAGAMGSTSAIPAGINIELEIHWSTHDLESLEIGWRAESSTEWTVKTLKAMNDQITVLGGQTIQLKTIVP